MLAAPLDNKLLAAQENVLAWKVRSSKARPAVPTGTRIYAVGDLHGCADLLSAMLRRIDEDLRARPTAKSIHVFLGDYIDRGPKSREVIDLLIARRRNHDMRFLAGNHEACASRFLDDPTVLSEWRHLGGINTLVSYGVTPTKHDDPQSQHQVAHAFRQALPDSHHDFMQGLALSFTCGDFFFAHAGVRPGIPLDKQRQQDLLWIRDDFLLHEEDFGKIVVHGHTPTAEPVVRSNRINIDTGAYATGRLTCLVLDGDKISFL
jgi:serine/threonine protein phosphatase 1